jgi:pimeloyl-ACP methyl ester carboxylesterase
MAAMLSRACRLWLLAGLLAGASGLSGCAGLPTRIESRFPPAAASGIVLVVDGAGGYQNAPRAIAAAVDEMHLPLHVRSYDWTHGWGPGLADVLDHDYSRCQGRRLAEEICQYRRACPGVPVYLVGYSAGSAVALAAAEALPPDTVERIVLLAPAVSASYDLRRALASARLGLDAFSSERDRFYLGLGTGLVGTADGKREAAAGRVGFCPPALSPAEACLAGRLRQYPWNRSVAWTGHQGGHTGSLRPAYLKAFVVPLLLPPIRRSEPAQLRAASGP